MAIYFYNKKEPYYQFSNFYPSPITIDNKEYRTAEHFYQASKFLGPNATTVDKAYAEIIRLASSPGKVFALARQKLTGRYSATQFLAPSDRRLIKDFISQSKKDGVKMRPDWEIVKDNIMRKAIWAKFTQHSELWTLLVDTGDVQIYEDAPRDDYWGLGKNKKGQNMLGRILMEVRCFLSGDFPEPPSQTSNWVIPQFLLASAYLHNEELVNEVMSAGINFILSLQEPPEELFLFPYRKIIDPHFETPQSAGFCEKVYSEPYSRQVTFARIPIQDHQIANDNLIDQVTDALAKAIGKHLHLMIHCLGGKGRTGTVIAVLLGKMYGMTADEALNVLASSFKSRHSKGRGKLPRQTPETQVQFAQVYRLLK